MARELVLTIDTCTVHLAGVPRLRPDLGYAGASARKLFQSDRYKASDPKRYNATP